MKNIVFDASVLNWARQSRPSMLDEVFFEIFTQPAVVIGLQRMAASFFVVTIAAEIFKTASLAPRHKLQIAFGVLSSQAYTPLSWDSADGTLRLLGNTHGDTPAAQWLKNINIGDTCNILGPSILIDLPSLRYPTLFFGDESSFALAHSLLKTESSLRNVSFLFEVTSISESRQVLRSLNITAPILIQRCDGQVHLSRIEAEAIAIVDAFQRPQFIFSGNTPSIGRLRQSLKLRDVPSRRMVQLH